MDRTNPVSDDEFEVNPDTTRSGGRRLMLVSMVLGSMTAAMILMGWGISISASERQQIIASRQSMAPITNVVGLVAHTTSTVSWSSDSESESADQTTATGYQQQLVMQSEQEIERVRQEWEPAITDLADQENRLVIEADSLAAMLVVQTSREKERFKEYAGQLSRKSIAQTPDDQPTDQLTALEKQTLTELPQSIEDQCSNDQAKIAALTEQSKKIRQQRVQAEQHLEREISAIRNDLITQLQRIDRPIAKLSSFQQYDRIDSSHDSRTSLDHQSSNLSHLAATHTQRLLIRLAEGHESMPDMIER